MAAPPKYAKVMEWVTTALESIGGENGKLVLNVNGGVVYADEETTNTELDEQGRKVKVKRIATTCIPIEIDLPVRGSKTHR